MHHNLQNPSVVSWYYLVCSVVAKFLNSLTLIWKNVPKEGNALADVTMQALEKYRKINAYKVGRVDWLLPSCFDVLMRDNES